MKKTIKIFAINLAVLVVLLVLLEGLLRFTGTKSIFQREKENTRNELRFKQVCQKLATTPLKVYHSFYTDQEGIFKAHPDYFKALKKSLFINADGFRGHPFEPVQTPRKKVLLIGDSFTWGVSANPLTNSFADLLDEAGYYIYNGGIPGTDPMQYAKIAEKYTPCLKPDIVAVCLYLGNDIGPHPALLQPNKNLYYITNFGYLRGYDDCGHFFKDAQEAFRYLKKMKCSSDMSLWETFLLKTAIGGKIYNLINKNRFLYADPTRKWVTAAMQRIQNIANTCKSQFIIFIIPFKKQQAFPQVSVKKNLHLFKDFLYYYPENLILKDYSPDPDNHLNNQGHKKFAAFITQKLTALGFPPVQSK